MSTGTITFLYKGGEGVAVPAHATHVWVDASVEVIRPVVFRHCRELKEVYLPEGLKRIGSGAFQGCVSLERINLPSTLESIGLGTFRDCEKLEISSPLFVYTGEGGAAVPPFATHVWIDQSITAIPVEAFINHSYLVEVKLSEGLQEFRSRAFSGSSLARIKIPSSVRVIGESAFAYCSKLVGVELPEGLHVIRQWAFRSCWSLKKITLPSSIRVVSFGAFHGCRRLNEIILPDAIQTIERHAFRGCRELQVLRIPQLVTKLERNTFDGCNRLFSLELPEGLIHIENFTFSGCTISLRNIAIPKKCTYNFGGLGTDLSNLFPKDFPALVDALKNRFDGLSIHKICYYQSKYPTSVIESLSRRTNSTSEQRAIATGMLQDSLGMTPLHILACSTSQSLELYLFLLDIYVENLIIEDRWGCIPLLYAVWRGAPQEILQLLVKTHQKTFPNHVLDWKGMAKTLANANAHQVCFQNLIDTQQTDFQNHTVDWEAVITELVQSPSTCYKETVRFFLTAIISKRLNSLGIGKRGEEMMREVDTWRYPQQQSELIGSLFSKLATYEYQNEVTSLLELALWKGKMDQSASTDRLSNGEGRYKKTKSSVPRTRVHCHNNCGAEIVLPNVVPFLFSKKD
eukprot:CAMPEP_0172325076 /NCGR_PEP_ID=MMETSP1058-20130122/53089_1 /TAXON_ID=83371 /ORGANISM="Detonula confervacea, Strain CCMP 353" /LENGTH=628 /DNA_ID=CAMNT_0013041527 /DNA_START=19 /DNA_END=1905 /DNA_ORIENTATION=+